MPRLFVAIEPPDDVKDRLERLCNGLKGARWVAERQFHLTLRFIGEVDGPRARDVAEILHGLRADPFELELDGLGCFPLRGKPKVLWAGVAPCEELTHLHAQVARVLKRAGLGPEERKFTPHVTLARLAGTPPEHVLRYVAVHDEDARMPFAVTEAVLFSSVLGRRGAQHSVVETYPLFARSPDRGPD